MKSKLGFHLSRFTILIWVGIIIIFSLLSIFLCAESFYEPVKIDASILIADSSSQVTPSELFNHNVNLVSSLQMRESLDANSIISSNDGIRQTRSIYIGIVGILLTFVLTKNNKYGTYVILLCIIITFYGLDIHLSDLLQRSIVSKRITSNSLDLIVKEKPFDKIWYDINYSTRNFQFIRFHDTRIWRKLKAAFHPEIVQLSFFIFPFITIYLILLFRSRRNTT